MRILSRRIANLEGKAKPIKVAEQFNWSMIEPAALEWLKSRFAITLLADGTHDYSEVSCDELRHMEWLMERSSRDGGIANHKPGCRCYYCQPLPSRT